MRHRLGSCLGNRMPSWCQHDTLVIYCLHRVDRARWIALIERLFNGHFEITFQFDAIELFAGL